MDLTTATAELYQVLPSEFVAVRDAKVAEARAAGDRPLATAIKALRRPTTSAWLANWLARERADDLGRLLALGAAMRQAQNHLEGDELRQLSRQRHRVVAALVTEARRAAVGAGLAVGEQSAGELESTLNAALADDTAARALESGRLHTPLQQTGYGLLDAAPMPAPIPKRQRQTRSAPAETEPTGASRQADTEAERLADVEAERLADAEAERRHRRDVAAEALTQAEAETAEAAQSATNALRVAAEAGDRLGRSTAEVAELEERLASAREELATATEAMADAQATLTAAQATASDAEERVTAAREELSRWR